MNQTEKYNKEVSDLLCLVVDNPTFKDGLWKELSISIQIKKNYATTELFSDNNILVSKDVLNKAIVILSENKSLCVNEWFKEMAIAVSSLNVKHNNVSWKDSLSQCGISLPLSNDLLKCFLVSRATNTIPFSYRYISTNVDDLFSMSFSDNGFNSISLLFNDTSKFNDLRELLYLIFDYKSLRLEVKNSLDSSNKDIWFSKLMCSLLFEFNYSEDIAIGYMSNMAKLWSSVVNSSNCDLTAFFKMDCSNIILSSLFEDFDYKKIDFKNFYEDFMVKFCLLDEKRELMFLDKVSYDYLVENDMLFSNFLRNSPILKREYIKLKLHQDSPECSSDSNDFKL